MRKILLVEDEPTLRDAYTMILSSGAFDVTAAPNGEVALEHCKQDTFDLILLDLMMPVLDGVGFMKSFSRHEGFPDTKVIVMSNLSSGEQLNAALDHGAHSNLVKAELSPKELLDVVRDHLD